MSRRPPLSRALENHQNWKCVGRRFDIEEIVNGQIDFMLYDSKTGLFGLLAPRRQQRHLPAFDRRLAGFSRTNKYAHD
jgi:hypothetical protein